MFEPKLKRSEVLDAIDKLMIEYEEKLEIELDDAKREKYIEAHKALEKVELELGIGKMLSSYRMNREKR